ncbi:MAG TPA: chemotaxis protein CheW, partial [Gemmatimonadaceae bacterium]|jgi:purine-binding chemotaxis protein CheW|nr:chemotaxis protein CheW [Gemmatimonadaceae bacterium]
MSEAVTVPPEQLAEEEPQIPTRRLLAFEVGANVFACDMDSFREIVPVQRTTRLPGAPDTVCGLINLRGTIVTVIDG